MKTKFIAGMGVVLAVLLVTVATAVLVTACKEPEDEDESEPVYTVPEEFWGRWTVITEGGESTTKSRLTISKDSVDSSKVSDFKDIKFERLGEDRANMVRLSYRHYGNYYVYYLLPQYTKPISFTGNVVSLDSAAQRGTGSMGRAVGGIGGIQVIVSNLDKPGQTFTTTTDSDGNFTVENAVPGDNYEVKVEGQTIPFMPAGDGENMGTITVTNGMSFKVSHTYSGNFDTKLYSGEDYSINIRLTNTGTARAVGTQYKITLGNGLTSASALSGILGTVDPGETKDVSLRINSARFNNESGFIWRQILVELYDPISGRTWNDSVSVLFYNSSVRFWIVSNSLIIISPNGETYAERYTDRDRFLSNDKWWYYARITTPSLRGDYLMIVRGNEAIYALGKTTTSSDDYSVRNFFLQERPNFTDTGRYKPNQTEAQAAEVTLPIMAYLIKDTFDFYRVKN